MADRKRGIERARQAMQTQRFGFVVDGSQIGWSTELFEFVTRGSKPCLILLNKSDKGIEVGDDNLPALF